jgi:arsenite methyltransferase
MLQRAAANAAKAGVTNVRFIESPVTKLNLRDAAADCIISNCVINLVPAEEKQLAFEEMYRVLKPGGRVAISDILARKELPQAITQSMALRVGCIAGASQVGEYETYLTHAGFDGKPALLPARLCGSGWLV